jgi:hypothetical protein
MTSPQKKPLTQASKFFWYKKMLGSYSKPSPQPQPKQKAAIGETSQTRNSGGELREKKEEIKRLKVEKIKSIQNREMLQVLEEEQKLEASRDLRLRESTNDQERETLERDFGKERSKAQKRIKNMMRNHKEVLAAAEK